MPVTTSYPGIYLEELPSSSHTIAAAPTSIAVFVGYTHPFKTNVFGKAVEIFSFADYEREFGGFSDGKFLDQSVAQAVNQFFLNGGSQAYVVGLKADKYFDASGQALTAPLLAPASAPLNDVTFVAREPTDPTPIRISIDNATSNDEIADVTVSYGNRPPEIHRNVSINATIPPTATNPNFIVTRMSAAKFVSVAVGANAKFVATPATPPTTFTPTTAAPSLPLNGVTFTALNPTQTTPIQIVISNVTNNGRSADVTITSGTAPADPTFTNVSVDQTVNTVDNPDFIRTRMKGSAYVTVSPLGANPKLAKTTTPQTIQATVPTTAVTTFDATRFGPVFATDSDLDKLPIFNILVLPGVTDPSVLSTAIAFAERKDAFVILDPPANSVAGQQGTASPLTTPVFDYMNVVPKSPNAALYFPYLKSSNPLGGPEISIAPSGFVAGIYARTDTNRGVWKAPAGLEATVRNTVGVIDDGRMNDKRQGVLNLTGINCLRTFPQLGTVVFGARTVVSNNTAFEQSKYVPVRRMTLFIKQTLYRSLGWAVFEPNDEPLWVALRTSVENFMLSMFSRGAFQGSKPSQAFYVECGASTTTQTDINNGIVNIVVAFAPLKPAEFVIVKIQQIAGQAQ